MGVTVTDRYFVDLLKQHQLASCIAEQADSIIRQSTRALTTLPDSYALAGAAWRASIACDSVDLVRVALENEALADIVRGSTLRDVRVAERTIREVRIALERQVDLESVTQDVLSTVGNRLRMLDDSWLLHEAQSVSLAGFTRLSLLRDTVYTTEPFDQALSEFLSDELGTGIEAEIYDDPTTRDLSAVQTGLTPELIAFQPSSYHRVIEVAGFSIIPAPVPQSVESSQGNATFDGRYGMLITQVEQHLRRRVETTLRDLSGPRWIKQRVPQTVRERWQQCWDEDNKAKRPVFHLVQYSNFMDLCDVIMRADNWRDVFKSIFLSKEDFAASMHRLRPIRNAIAHSRPLCRADKLTLECEAIRILRALGVAS